MRAENQDNFLKTRFSFGLIVRADVQEIEALKKFVSDHNLTVVFQLVETGHLWIIRRDAGDGARI